MQAVPVMRQKKNVMIILWVSNLEGSDDLPFAEEQYQAAEVVAALQQAYPKIQQHLVVTQILHLDVKPTQVLFLTGRSSGQF